MKKIKAVILTICLILLGTIGTNITEVHADTGDTFTAKISNTPTGGSEQKIDCLFKITKEAENGSKGEVRIGNRVNVAIDKSTEGSITIPKGVTNTTTGNTYTVTSIGDYAFANCGKLISTGLENNSSVISIGNYAFMNCDSLKSTGLESNNTVTTLGKGAFYYCDNLEKVILSKDSKISNIGDVAFARCDNLSAFVISGDTVPTFGIDVFDRTASDFAIYYPVHVMNGNASINQADASTGKQINNSFTKDAKVTITANSLMGKQFKDWSIESGNVVLADGGSSSTTFTITDEVIKLTANYSNINYNVMVDNGTGSGKYVMNDTVTISANQAPEGQHFKEWQIVSGDIKLKEPTKETTTFPMPASDVRVKAVYEDTQYTVSVEHGTGSGHYVKEETVTIQADKIKGKEFDKWEVIKGNITIQDNEETTFIMPAEDVEIRALYKDAPVTKPIEPTPPKDDTGKPVSPETGDTTEMGVWMMFFIATSGLLTIFTSKKRKL